MKRYDASIPWLKSVPYLAGLSPTVLATVAAHCRLKSLRKGQFVFMEGEPCQDLCILASGRVKCYRTSAEGREQVMKVFDRPGDTFCIPSAFSTGRHIVTAKALTETRLYSLEVDTVNRLAREHPSLALWLVATAGDQMQTLVTLAEDLSLRTATARLAKLLCEVALVDGVRAGNEILVRRERLREEEIASLLGTVRVHVSRSLKRLASAGAIALSREVICIPDLIALRRLSEGNCQPR